MEENQPRALQSGFHFIHSQRGVFPSSILCQILFNLSSQCFSLKDGLSTEQDAFLIHHFTFSGVCNACKAQMMQFMQNLKLKIFPWAVAEAAEVILWWTITELAGTCPALSSCTAAAGESHSDFCFLFTTHPPKSLWMVKADRFYKHSHPKFLSCLGAMEHAVILSSAPRPRQLMVRGAIPAVLTQPAALCFAHL